MFLGRYRTGKSFLLNRILGSNFGFKVGSESSAMTKGIWMRCVPHPEVSNARAHSLRKGLFVFCDFFPQIQDELLLLLDTEGLDSSMDGIDEHIMMLACLLSRTLVYNQRGALTFKELMELQ